MVGYNGVNYELESVLNLLEEKNKHGSSISETEIQQFEADSKIRKMTACSEQDIEQGKVLSTKEVIEKVRNGKI
ncbi:hypothetical protein [Lentibacillus sp. CBA3610]|uniref:hypothetical protein n=1 Tax=Lentibacillus sp. CBA3610 TaxID=2518176 RepID=UPI0015960866|nr:hypothetical protein [Lentibacillus sp. CBA3610]QKY71167.1 hypothetical protein Len3610_17810 [Lentibacillus sp. CBA3610]